MEGSGVRGFAVRCIELGFESYGSNVGFRDRVFQVLRGFRVL